MSYAEFLSAKRQRAKPVGIEPPALHASLFPFQRFCTNRMLMQGRGALFQGCGLGKSRQAIEWAHAVQQHTKQLVLIITPLAVASQFVREAEAMGRRVVYVREPGDVPAEPCILVTNYERLERFAGLPLGGVVLDESSILKAFDGKTRTRLIEAFTHVPYRLCCTATAAPNDHTELGNHAEFLGVCTMAEMLATWFVHDGGDTSKWRLKGHAQGDFWKWVASWAVSAQKPSDLGFTDEGYDLTPLHMHEHVVDVDGRMANQAGLLFAYEAVTLTEQRSVKRASLHERVEMATRIINDSTEQWTVWCELNDESQALARAITGAIEVTGSDSAERKESGILGFIDGKHRVLVSKSDICGFGVNMQNCANTLFIGASHSFERLYQTVRRHYRFGQKREVHCHIISTSADGRVLANMARKQDAAETMQREMVRAMSVESESRAAEVPTYDTRSGENWSVTHGDCVRVFEQMSPDSVDFSVYSPPFASLYTYSDSDADMGNCRTHDEFFEHYTYLLRHLLRATKPGRNSSVHCMTLPTSKTRDGVIGLSDFPGRIIRAHEEAGWIYHSKVTVWKDPVTAMQRTKAIGLLWKQIKKDSTISRQGIPDEVLTFRKPGANPEPVSHTADEFPVDQWQKWASPVWMDINPSDTLQYMSAREEKDERHICPLQLEVIRRCIRLWSNRGDIVASPFTGIGSEGYVALEEGRRFIGAELKRSYFVQACANLEAIRQRPADLFGAR